MPTLEQMQDLVVNRKRRPIMSREVAVFERCASSSATITDCWDQDAEARLSASNVKERVRAMFELMPNPDGLSTFREWREQQRCCCRRLRSTKVSSQAEAAGRKTYEMVPRFVQQGNGRIVFVLPSWGKRLRIQG